MKSGGEFDGHGGDKGVYQRRNARRFLMRKMRGAKRVFIFLEEFLGMGEFRFREPGVFFHGISFPSDQVLSTGRSSSVFQDFLDLVMFLIFQKIWGRRWEVLPIDGVLVIK